MQAKFKTKTYDCLNVRQSNANDGANTLSLVLANIEDLEEVKAEATDCDHIEILDGETVTQTYDDYVNFRSIAQAEDQVEVVVNQPSLVKQVANLKATVQEQAAVIEGQAQTIAEQAATIANQAEMIAGLEASQADQDDQITEIQEVIVEM